MSTWGAACRCACRPVGLELASAGRPATVWQDEDGRLRLALLLVVFTGPDDETPRDVHEQELCLGDFAEQPVERWIAYLQDACRALPVILGERGDDPTVLLPSDLFAYDEPLADPALNTADEFAAVLADPARLAAWDRACADAGWREMLAPCGLADQIDAVRALVRPALRLELERDDWRATRTTHRRPASATVGSAVARISRPGWRWPEQSGRPLVFVGQFDLAALARHPAARELPAQGLLSFLTIPGRGRRARQHAVRVLHLRELDALTPRSPPADGESLTEHSLRVRPELAAPRAGERLLYDALLPEAQVMACSPLQRLGAGNGANPPIDPSALGRLVDVMSDREWQRPIHQVLGCADSIQGDPYLDVEISTQPGGWSGWDEGSPRAYQLRRHALQWRLLLQIDAVQDGELLLNQDGGSLDFSLLDPRRRARGPRLGPRARLPAMPLTARPAALAPPGECCACGYTVHRAHPPIRCCARRGDAGISRP